MSIAMSVLWFSLVLQPTLWVTRLQAAEGNRSELASLLGQLAVSKDARRSSKDPESSLRDVESRLIRLTEESDSARMEVIEAAIKIIDDPIARDEWPVANRWIICVDLLGYLRATEGIEVLVRNLDHTGENGIVSSIHYAPIRKALENIGKPAVAALIKALNADEEEIRYQAAATLGGIGKPALSDLLEVLSGERPAMRGTVAMVLAGIGGAGVKASIEQAIATEVDESRRAELKQALADFERRWEDK